MSRDSYEPYFIYDFKSGLRLDKQPWLSPADAFNNRCLDWFVYQGVLKKRGGTTAFSEMVHVNPCAFGEGKFGEGRFGIGRVETNPGNAVMGIFSHYQGLSETLLIMDTERFNKYNTATMENDDLTRLTLPIKLGVKQFVAGDTITGVTSGDTAVVDAIVVDNGDWGDGDLHGTLIISSAAEGDFAEAGEVIQVNGYNVATTKGSASYIEMTGDDADFIWAENWRDVSYYTNNHEQIRKYDGSYITLFNIDLTTPGGPDNDVNTCLLIFHIQGMILLLRTVESGESYYQRARWSRTTQRGQAVIFDADGYSDANRDDQIMGADFIGDDLIVWFERGAMKLVYTTDPDIPFKWENIPSQEGLYATMSLAPFSTELIGVGPTRFVATDGREVYGIDEKIPDFMLQFNQTAVNYCFALVIEETKQILTTFPEGTASKPNRVLALNYDENTYAVFSLAAHVMGYSALDSTLKTDEMTGISLDDLNYSLDDKELRAGYPTTLMGKRDGTIFKMNDGSQDNGLDFTASLLSARLNPYIKKNLQAELGYIDFLVKKSSSAYFNVSSYVNTESTPFQTKTVYCSDDSTPKKDKVWKRVDVGCEGGFHRIGLEAPEIGPEIHAIALHFKPGGPLY